MQVVEYLVIFAILLALVAFVTAPLRRALVVRPDETGSDLARATELAELEAAREAKLRELRDADMDHRTGKLSDADYEELDQTLRGEAIAIMHDIDRATIDDQ